MIIFQLIVDVLAHDSPEIMDKLWLKELRSGNFQLKDKSTARRYILPLIKNEKELMVSKLELGLCGSDIV